MALTALNTSATALSALTTDLDIIANNLANVNTVAFKSSRANFEDLLYEERVQPGVENATGSRTPAGLMVGLGTRISNTQLDFGRQGSAINTGRELDVMVQGQGLFQVETPPDVGEGTGYTRAGNFFVNSDGELVLGNSQGPRLVGGITIPPNTTAIEITPDGDVNVFLDGDTTPQLAGTIQLANFINPEGLKSTGGNVFVQTEASGDPILGNPGEGNFGILQQRFLESSNVDAVTELVNLIKTQRAFEMNSQVIQAGDETLQVIANLRRV